MTFIDARPSWRSTMAESQQERVARTNRVAEAKRGRTIPLRSRSATHAVVVILAAAFVIAAAVVAWMFANNVRYDGTSPAPVSERR
jgi:hypothetical protein